MTSNSGTTAGTTAGQSGPQRENSRITATAAPQRENSGRTAGQQQDKPNNSRTTRTTARQQRHNSGTTWTTTRFLFSFLTRDVSHNIRSPRSPTAFETPLRLRHSLAEPGEIRSESMAYMGYTASIYSCCVRSARHNND